MHASHLPLHGKEISKGEVSKSEKQNKIIMKTLSKNSPTKKNKSPPPTSPPCTQAHSHAGTHTPQRPGRGGKQEKKDQDQLSDGEQRTCRREAGSCARSVAARTERVQEGDGLKGEYMVRNCGCSGWRLRLWTQSKRKEG